MIPGADSAITRNEKSLIVAYDHGLEHGPVDFEPNPATADPDRVFEIGTHDAVTAVAVQKGIAEGYYPSYENDVTLLAKLNGSSATPRRPPATTVSASSCGRTPAAKG